MDRKEHWEKVYQTKSHEEVSWFQAVPEQSLLLIEGLSLDKNKSIIDVGGGTSSLAEELFKRDFRSITVLDISLTAIKSAFARSGFQSEAIKWIESDVLEFDPPKKYDLWHDRAVFHFLVDEWDRRKYLDVLKLSLSPTGYVIIASFAEDGPETCSGLAVRRYSPELLSEEMGTDFKLIESKTEVHLTPANKEQRFQYSLFKYLATDA